MTGFDDNGTAQEGHNSGAGDSPETPSVAANQLRSFLERIERLNEEKEALAVDIREVYGEAKAMGYDVPSLRKIIQVRKKDRNELMEERALMDTYYSALGMDFML